jgi:hypothetical protein
MIFLSNLIVSSLNSSKIRKCVILEDCTFQNSLSEITFFTNKLDYIITIALIRGATCLKYKFLSKVCFGMIFSYFAIDIMDIYGLKGM